MLSTKAQRKRALESYCPRDYYILDPEHSALAIEAFRLKERRALDARRALLTKFQATCLYREGPSATAIGFAPDQPIPERHLFTRPIWDRANEVWKAAPRKRIAAGRAILEEMQHVAELSHAAAESLQDDLALHGAVLYDHAFHVAVAIPLQTGGLAISLPKDLNRPRGPNYSRSFDAPRPPRGAKPITKQEWMTLTQHSDTD